MMLSRRARTFSSECLMSYSPLLPWHAGTPVISEEEKSKVLTVLDQLLCSYQSE